MAWLYFVVLDRPADQERQSNPAIQAAFSVGKIVQFSLPLVCIWAWERRMPRLTAPTARGLAYGVGFGILTASFIFALYFALLRGSLLLKHTPAQLWAKLEAFGLATTAGYFLLAAFFCVVHSMLEEYYWRWFVFGWLKRLVPVLAAIILSSLAFMAHHLIILTDFFPGHFWTLALPFTLGVALGGAVWAWIYHLTGSIYSPWVSHLLVDAAIMVVGYDLLFGLF
jgi:membrane protease YdiL (CAAX protease family)